MSILDYLNQFKQNPLVISSRQKIDGFDTITLDIEHCYIDFIFNKEKGTWHTNDYILENTKAKKRFEMADNQNLSERLEYTVEPIEDKDLKTKNDLYDGVNADKLDVESIQNNLDLDEYLKEVQTDNIVDAAVTEVKIFDASVTVDKLADDSVTNNKIADDAVRTEKIKNSAITTAKIAAASVTNDKLEKRTRKTYALDELSVYGADNSPFADGSIYFKIEKDTKTLTVHNLDDDTQLKILLEAEFESNGLILEPLIYFLDFRGDSWKQDIEIFDDPDDDDDYLDEVDEAMMRLDDQYVIKEEGNQKETLTSGKSNQFN